MWAAAANSVPFTPQAPRLHPPLRRARPPISASFVPRRRISTPPDEDEPHDGVGGLGHAVLAAFKSPSTHDGGTRSGKTKLLNKKQENDRGDEETAKELSGSDILWALQKASARRKNKKKIGTSTSKSKMKGKEDAEQDEKDEVYSNVRPIKIKSEWSRRLDELEKQLQQLSEI